MKAQALNGSAIQLNCTCDTLGALDCLTSTMSLLRSWKKSDIVLPFLVSCKELVLFNSKSFKRWSLCKLLVYSIQLFCI